MTTSRPARRRPSRARGFLGLIVGFLLVLLPLMHNHPAAATSGPVGQAHSSCTLCAVFAGMDTPSTGSVSIGLHESHADPCLLSLPVVATSGRIGVDGRAPPLASA
jgi:hypothetical protein